MKIKNIFQIIAAMTLSFAISSCTDENDWSVDGAFDRLFGTTADKISVEPGVAEPTEATVTFAAVPDAQYYIIEVSKDSLYDEVEMGGPNAMVYKTTDLGNESTSNSTYIATIKNLSASTAYHLRIKSMAEGKGESKWAYYKDGGTFKTKSEQIITSVVPGSNNVIVNFQAGKTVNKAYIYLSETDSVETAITTDQVAAGTITISGLTPVTKYTVALYNDDVKRGSMSFTTTEAYPEGYSVLTVAEGEDLMAKLKESANSNVVVVFAQGTSYALPTKEDGGVDGNIPSNIKSIYFWGAAGETKPTFTPDGLNFEGNMGLVRFYNLNIENASSNDDYVICQTSNINIQNVEFESCTISKTRGIIRLKDMTGGSMENITINNCVMTDIGTYGLFNGKDRKNTTMKNFTLTNSTVATMSANALVNTSQAGAKITVDQCTFYNCVPGGKSFFDVNKFDDILTEVSNTLIGPYYNKKDETTVKGCSMKGQISFNNVYYTGDFNWNSGYELGEQIEGVFGTDLFKDPDNGDFTLQSNYSGRYGAYGDQRWNTEE